MGVNLKCASCHNSFINTWKLADSYGMAGIYADGPLEMVRCDKPTGQIAPIQFIYPELGKIDDSAPREKRLAQLAAILTSRANGRTADGPVGVAGRKPGAAPGADHRFRLHRPGGKAHDRGAVCRCGRLTDRRLAQTGEPTPNDPRPADPPLRRAYGGQIPERP